VTSPTTAFSALVRIIFNYSFCSLLVIPMNCRPLRLCFNLLRHHFHRVSFQLGPRSTFGPRVPVSHCTILHITYHIIYPRLTRQQNIKDAHASIAQSAWFLERVFKRAAALKNDPYHIQICAASRRVFRYLSRSDT